MWASDLDQFDNTCADADGATGRAEISCPMSGPFHTCVSLPRDSPFTRVTHGPHGRESMRFVYRHGIPTSTCVKGASKSVCTTSVRNTARMQGSGQQAISEKEILDRFGHNYTRSAARLQLQKLPQVHLRIMIAEAAISTLQHVCISRHEDKHSWQHEIPPFSAYFIHDQASNTTSQAAVQYQLAARSTLLCRKCSHNYKQHVNHTRARAILNVPLSGIS